MIYSGAENRTRQTGRVIGDLYSPDSFDTRLGEWASVNVQPCCSLHFNKTEKLYSFRALGFRALVSEILEFRLSRNPAFRTTPVALTIVVMLG